MTASISTEGETKSLLKPLPRIRYLKLVKRYLWMSFRSRIEYKVSFYFEIFFQIVMLIISLLFWQVIFLKTTQFGEWTFDAVLMLHLYSQIFVAIFLVFFMGCHVFWRSVQTGKLDIYLTRPLDPRLAFLAENIRFQGSYRLFINLFVISAILWLLEIKVNIITFCLTLVMILLGVLAVGTMQLTANCIAFWWIRSDALDEFLDSIWEFYRYPLTVLPWVIQFILTFGMPIIFAATWPALFLSESIDFFEYSIVLCVLIFVVIFWYILLQIAWNKGLNRYESGGG